MIKRAQKRATRLILKSDIDYAVSRLKNLNLQSLEQSRFMAYVTFLYKTLNGYLNVDLTKYLDFYSMQDRYIVRGSDSMKLKKNFARTNHFNFFFFNRIVDTWDSLPSSIHNSSNLKTFRINLMKHLTCLSRSSWLDTVIPEKRHAGGAFLLSRER